MFVFVLYRIFQTIVTGKKFVKNQFEFGVNFYDDSKFKNYSNISKERKQVMKKQLSFLEIFRHVNSPPQTTQE